MRQPLQRAAVAFAIAVGVHGLDHLRRGLMASPADVVVVGTIQIVIVAVATWMALTDRRRAPEVATCVGFASAVLFFYAHVLPMRWPVLSDSFVSAPHHHVNWFSWVTAVGEITTGVVLGITGLRAVKARNRRSYAGTTGYADHR